MAFTSTTFNFLKQTVLDSMAEDAKNGLITGKVMKTGGFQTATFYARLISNEVTRAVFNVSKNFCPEHEPNIIEKIADVQTIDGVIYVREYGKNDKQRLGKWMNKNLELDATHKDEIIKQTVNGVAAKVKTTYWMFTDRNIDQHYRVLAQERDVNSCMSKPPRNYGQPRASHIRAFDWTFEEAALARAKYAGVPVDSPTVEYVHPCEAYNGTPNCRLALATFIDPTSDEFKISDEYPFVARAIVQIDDGKLIMPRVYGDERAITAAQACPAFLLGHEFTGLELNMPSNVAPYIDCDNTIIEDEHGTCFGVSSEVAYDLCCDGEVYHIYRADVATEELETRPDYTYCPNCGRAYPVDSDYLNVASAQEDSGEITHYCKHCVPKYLR